MRTLCRFFPPIFWLPIFHHFHRPGRKMLYLLESKSLFQLSLKSTIFHFRASSIFLFCYSDLLCFIHLYPQPPVGFGEYRESSRFLKIILCRWILVSP